jgi:hypothetical protein
MADLYAGKDFIAQAELTRTDLAAGDQTFVLVFPGGFISNRGLDGPYSLKNVVVLDLKDSPVQTAFAAAPTFATQTYQASKFVHGTLTLDKTLYEGSAVQAQIAVKNVQANLSQTTKDQIFVRVSSAKNAAGFNVALTEMGVNTGEFVGTVGFSTKAGDAQNGVILVSDHDLLTVVYTDAQGCRWSETALWRQMSGGIGDLNSDGRVDLADAIMAMCLTVRASIPAETEINPLGMMDAKGRITMQEAVYILQKTADLR